MAKHTRWYAAASPALGRAFQVYHDAVTEQSSLDRKTIELIKLAVSSVLRCPHCTEDHIEKALEAGASRQEVSDALHLSALQGAGTQLYWTLETFEKHLGGGRTPPGAG
jgi:AhpD family alkylhydroperoxidase